MGSEERGERPTQRLLGWSSTSSITKGSEREGKKGNGRLGVNTSLQNYEQWGIFLK